MSDGHLELRTTLPAGSDPSMELSEFLEAGTRAHVYALANVANTVHEGMRRS
jgi:hypothetical protein